MAWFKVDDAFHSSKPVVRIPRRYRAQAVGLWILAGTWCVRHETGGKIPNYVAAELGATAALTQHLVDSGLWERTEEGWRFTEWRKSQDGDYRRNIRKSVREAVMERDGYACVLCSSSEQLSLDHIQRYRDDGPDTIDNLRVLCMPCNLERG